MFPNDKPILIIDDTLLARQLVSNLLIELGFRIVIQADDGDTALDKIHASEAENKPFQLIITDIMMKRVDGLEFLKRLRGLGNQTPVVMLTAENERATVMEAMKLGANNYIVKPVEKDVLFEKLARVYEATEKKVA